jgi:hypothetical protein
MKLKLMTRKPGSNILNLKESRQLKLLKPQHQTIFKKLSYSALALAITLLPVLTNTHQAIATSQDYTWQKANTNLTGDQKSWSSITSSADGTKLAAGVISGSIYTSTDSGTTWTEQTAAGSRYWYSITSSADGTKLAAVAYGGSIYTSGDFGTTWTEQTAAGTRSWYSITSSADGTKLAAVAYGGSIYTSGDFGTTWTEQTAVGTRSWSSITSSADGTKLAAVEYGGSIHLGTQETETPPAENSTNTVNLATPTSSISAFSLRPVTLTTPVGTNITSSSTVPESSLATQDSANQYPLGLVNFQMTTNQTNNQIVLTFETNLLPSQVTPRKFNPNTNTYNNLPTSANATVTETIIDGKHHLVLTYTLTDNGELDLDPTTGIVRDPVGLAVANSVYDELARTGEDASHLMLAAGAVVTLAFAVSFGLLAKRRSTQKWSASTGSVR